ncbi:ribosomal RNA processing protein 1 homolog A, partial [Striga asiatica]
MPASKVLSPTAIGFFDPLFFLSPPHFLRQIVGFLLMLAKIFLLIWVFVTSMCKSFLMKARKASILSDGSDFFSARNCIIPLRRAISSDSLHILWNNCFFSDASGSASLLFFDFLVTVGSVPLTASLLFFDFLVTVGSVPLTSSTALFLVDLTREAEAATALSLPLALEFFLDFLSDSDPESSSGGSGFAPDGVWGFLAAARGGEDLRIGSGSDSISSDEESSVSSSPEEVSEETGFSGSRDFDIF